MMNALKHAHPLAGRMFAAGALLLSVGLMGSCGEALDDFNSRIACEGYCAKKFDCDNHTPTGAETDTCVSACRDSIEDNCGNEHQAAANDKIDECVDKSCTDFWACMIFEAAPECLGFVN